MREKDAGDAARRKPAYRPRSSRRAHDTGKSAARLAPLEEGTPVGTGRTGAGPDDAIRVGVDGLKPSGGLPDGDEPEHGVFYMPPVVSVTVSLFLAYTIFVAVLIALG
jgi:hypothetical protein